MSESSKPILTGYVVVDLEVFNRELARRGLGARALAKATGISSTTIARIGKRWPVRGTSVAKVERWLQAHPPADETAGFLLRA